MFRDSPCTLNGENVVTHSEEETQQVGRALGENLFPGAWILLYGDLGAGKTVFARGVLTGLGLSGRAVTSPTFTLMNLYEEGRLPAAHYDLYRLRDPRELTELGLWEQAPAGGVALVEWPERGGDLLPPDCLKVELVWEEGVQDARRIHFSATGEKSGKMLYEWIHSAENRNQRRPSAQ